MEFHKGALVLLWPGNLLWFAALVLIDDPRTYRVTLTVGVIMVMVGLLVELVERRDQLRTALTNYRGI